MAVYAIGDVHGCLKSLDALLETLPSKAKYLFIGDTINRGPQTLDTIRRIMDLGDRADAVLGNHEIHLLGVYAGVRKMNPRDTIDQILDAPDCDDIIDWIRSKPLAIEKKGFLCVHAATHWSWSLSDSLAYSREVEKVLQADDWKDNIGHLFGKDQWSKDATGWDRLRGIANVFTRTRYLNSDGTMEYSAKLSPKDTDPALIPWFKYPGRKTEDVPVVFGHWSTLGPVEWKNIYSLDTACIWGGRLTAVKLKEPTETVSVKAPLYLTPKAD